MKRIDRYILGIFLKTFFFSIFLFSLIATAIDASEKSEDFIQSNLSFSDVIRLYYVGFVPHIVTLLFPVFVLVSVVFFTSRLAMRNEVVALLSTGMSLGRILRPYWIGGGILTLLLGLSNHFVIPVANKIRTDFELKYIHMGKMPGSGSAYMNNLHFRIDSNTYAGIRSYDTLTKTGQGFFMSTFSNGKMVKNVRAETISWDDKKKEWKLDNAVERKINGMNEDISQYPFYPLKMGYKPMDLIHDEYRKDKLKTPDLNQLIEKEQRRGSEAVVPLRFERYRRDSNALSVLIMTLMAGILASRKIRGGSGFHMAVAFVLGVTFILVDKFSMVFCIKGNLNPFIAAWLPPFLFGLLTMRLYIKSPK